MNPQSILAVFAHPDDEAFGTGGALAHYAAKGVEVTLVCATRGEVGEISDPALATPETLGQVREGELRCAAESMGVQEVVFLGYRDSGMVGTVQNSDPRAFINIPADRVIRQLVQIIRKFKPQIIVTFEPNGGYGHPDHIAIHKHTVAAYHDAADPTIYPELGPAWQTSRLFYTAIPKSFFHTMQEQMTSLGLDTSQLASLEESGAGWPDDQVDVSLDVTTTVQAKWEALNCHRTQFGPENLFRRLPEENVKALMSYEYFALAYPKHARGTKLNDLFDGL
jgi:N-acetyl-1-D-myo-inositol-2-amino-2-deoxy-alpha-D-glucopyranoside deacetylase